MKPTGRLALRCILPALVLPALLGPVAAPAKPAATEGHCRPAADSATAHVQPTVRLRKLHLVRPDLIPYPIAYEVYC
jgi:hypothetical protein